MSSDCPWQAQHPTTGAQLVLSSALTPICDFQACSSHCWGPGLGVCGHCQVSCSGRPNRAT